MSARALMAVARAILASVTVIAWVGMTFFEGAHFDGNAELWATIAISATAFLLAALVYAAPTFRLPEYVLNGLFALLIFPIVVSALYPAEGTEDSLPQEVSVAIRFSGPALLGLLTTVAIWFAVRWTRRDRNQSAKAQAVA